MSLIPTPGMSLEQLMAVLDGPNSTLLTASQLMDIYNAGGSPGCDTHCMLQTQTNFKYRPVRSVPIIAITLFSLSLVLHVVQMFYARMPWLCLMVIACALEVAGWAARLVAAHNPFTNGVYVLQTTVLFFGPVFMSATLYFILSTFVRRYAEPYCRVHWRWIVRGFVTCDVLSLFIQGGGGGWAAGSPNDATPGIHMMLGGMCIQVFGMTVYSILGLDVAWHVWKRREVDSRDRIGAAEEAEAGKGGAPQVDENGFVVPPARRPRMVWRARLPAESFGRLPVFGTVWKLFAVSTSVCTALLLMRCGYRIAELAKEWKGALFDHEIWFDLMDGLPMCIVCLLLNAMNPVVVFGRGTWREPKGDSAEAAGGRRRRRPALFWLTCGVCGRGGSAPVDLADESAALGGGCESGPLREAAQHGSSTDIPVAPPGEVRIAGVRETRW